MTYRELADELRGVLRALNEREHTPEQIADALAHARRLRAGLDGPRRARWYESGLLDGRYCRTIFSSSTSKTSMPSGMPGAPR